MKYSKTGKFTAKQKKLAEEIAEKIAELRKTGCNVYGKGYSLLALKKSEMEHAHPMERIFNGKSHQYEIKTLFCGKINDSGADDAEYFEEGYITEE